MQPQHKLWQTITLKSFSKTYAQPRTSGTPVLQAALAIETTKTQDKLGINQHITAHLTLPSCPHWPNILDNNF
jgi:hypothetical protein